MMTTMASKSRSYRVPEQTRLPLPERKDSFVEAVRRTIRERRLIAQGQTVLVACSGGADSVALAVILCVLAKHLRFSVRVAHIHHRIRGDDADADARWVANLAAALGLPCHVGSTDVPHLIECRRGSTEERARWARRLLLRNIADDAGADVIATAHHADDQAETVLMHILRGTGLSGLGGMAWGPEDGYIRPFLGTRRNEIRDALSRWGVGWREDATNESHEYTRNRIRHVLIPSLEADWNPQIVPAVARLAEISAVDDDALETIADEAWRSALIRRSNHAVILDCSRTRGYPLSIIRRIFRRAAEELGLADRTLSYAETDRLVALTNTPGDVTLRGRLSAWSNECEIWVELPDARNIQLEIPVPGELSVPGWGTFTAAIDSPPQDADVLEYPATEIRMPLRVRRWHPGDKITVARGKPPVLVAGIARKRVGHKALSIDAVDPRTLLVLEDEREILWAIGLVKAEPPHAPPDSPMILLGWRQK